MCNMHDILFRCSERVQTVLGFNSSKTWDNTARLLTLIVLLMLIILIMLIMSCVLAVIQALRKCTMYNKKEKSNN